MRTTFIQINKRHPAAQVSMPTDVTALRTARTTFGAPRRRCADDAGAQCGEAPAVLRARCVTEVIMCHRMLPQEDTFLRTYYDKMRHEAVSPQKTGLRKATWASDSEENLGKRRRNG
jgi:hypothetical protein